AQRVFGRAVGGAVFIGPRLREGPRGIGRRVGKGLVEADDDSVLPRLEPDGNGRPAGVADALETAVERRVGAPALQAGHVELPVPGMEAGALRTGVEIAGDPQRGGLPA